MNKFFLSLLFLSFFNLSHGQCSFGFEQIVTQSGEAVVIKKYGFPNNTEFRLLQFSASDGTTVTVDTTLTSQLSDTLAFGSQADSTDYLNLSALTPAGDTVGYFRAPTTNGGVYGFPGNIGVSSYTPPSSISSADGEIIFFDSTGTGFIPANVQNQTTTVFDTLSAGISEFLYVEYTTIWEFRLIIGNPEDWVNIGVGDITCPIGVNLATDQSTCDGEAYIGQVQNGVAPYTYEWNGSGTFGTDTTMTGLCVGNNYVTIQDQNGNTKTCAFAIGSQNNGYFPPNQSSDTTIHSFTDYCMDSIVDSVSVIGSQIIDSVSFSVVWSFYNNTTLLDQILDTVQITVPNGTYNNIELQLHLVCNGDTLKSTPSVYSTAGYVSLPFSETGFLEVAEVDLDAEVLVYPNPVSKNLNIELNNSEIKNVVILNDLGQEVGVDINRINTSHFILDLSSLNRGSYTIQLLTEDDVVHLKKVVKK